MKKALLLLITILAVGVAYIAFSDYDHHNETIYFGGDIVTMHDSTDKPEAVMVKDGKILAVGTKADVFRLKTEATALVDLHGKTLMPSFFDAHGHFDFAAVFYSMTDVSGVKYRKKEEVWQRIENAVKTAKANEWVFCYGFDPILTTGIESPTLAYLDSVSPDKPLVIITKALHVFYVNSRAFADLGITNKTPNPSKASYYERDAQGRLTGAIIEQEALEPIRLKMQEAIKNDFVTNTQGIMADYAKMGVTSIVNMGFNPPNKSLFGLYEHLAGQKPKPLYQLLAFVGKLPKRQPQQRIFLYLRKENAEMLPPSDSQTDDFYRIVGVKFWYDGSPYSGSMFLRQPYIRSNFTINGINLKENHTSHSLMREDELQRWVEKINGQGYPVAIHSQGDIANDEVMSALQKVHKKQDIELFRNRIEHCMLLPKEQLAAMKRLNLSPSFHINHLLFYGEFLGKEVIGQDRANRIFPIGSAAKLDIPYSLHADMPQFVPNPLVLANTSVNRQTEQGLIIAPNERVSVWQALKSITIDAAWQLHLDKKLGTIETGKYADLVILDKNPLKTKPQDLGKIQVQETIVAGNAIYKKP